MTCEALLIRAMRLDVIPTFLRFVTGSLIRVPNLMMATNDKGCARCGT